MSLSHLQKIREHEISLLFQYFEKGKKILEIGAGSGWQAKMLADLGYAITAVDLPSSNYKTSRVFEVIEYDGATLPFDNQKFDIVFTSNVLAHIINQENFLNEIYRVLKPQGLMIHIVPNSYWRFWTILAYYIVFPKYLLYQKTPFLKRFYPPRLGEKGNALKELYLFSNRHWKNLFRQQDHWKLLYVKKNKIFYTGINVAGKFLNISIRKKLSLILGSVSNIYILEKK